MSYKDIDVSEFKELSKDPNHIILDVRAEEEYAEGKIPNHTLINYFSTDFESELLKLDKSKSYLVYCRSGNRSGKVCSIMSEHGFTGDLYNLDGGINAWNEAHK